MSLWHLELTSLRDCLLMHPGKRVNSLIKMHTIGNCVTYKTFAAKIILTIFTYLGEMCRKLILIRRTPLYFLACFLISDLNKIRDIVLRFQGKNFTMCECFSGCSIFSQLYTTAVGAVSVREDSSNSFSVSCTSWCLWGSNWVESLVVRLVRTWKQENCECLSSFHSTGLQILNQRWTNLFTIGARS